MPSVRALNLGAVFALFAFSQLSTANPLPSRTTGTAPSLPVHGGGSELPSPPANQTLQYVAVGRGVQNYTCATSSSVPVALGAVATLFDATALAYGDESALNQIPPVAVYMPTSTPIEPYIPQLGHHYFAADGTPTFDLASVSKILYAKKTADIKAPVGADSGPAGTGAVDWLTLIAKPGVPAETSVGLQTVYRVVTAGGSAPATCSKAGVVSVQYAAEYWFYD